MYVCGPTLVASAEFFPVYFRLSPSILPSIQCTFVSRYDPTNIAIYRISRYIKNIAIYRGSPGPVARDQTLIATCSSM